MNTRHCERSEAIQLPAESKKAGSPRRCAPRDDGEGSALVVRTSKNAGTQLVRAGKGRWSAAAERRFFATLRATACVQRACAAAGFSDVAIYRRKANYPGFAGQWDEAIVHAKAELHMMVVGAGIATFRPELAGDGIETPKATVAEAIAILRLGGGKARGRQGPRVPDIAEVKDSILRKLAAIRAHRQRGGD